MSWPILPQGAFHVPGAEDLWCAKRSIFVAWVGKEWLDSYIPWPTFGIQVMWNAQKLLAFY